MKITAEIARKIQSKAMENSKVKSSIFRRIKRCAKKEYGAKKFYQDEINWATQRELRRRGFRVKEKDDGGYSVEWFKLDE